MNFDEQAALFNGKVMVQKWYSEAFDEICYNGFALASIISLSTYHVKWIWYKFHTKQKTNRET